MKKKIVLILMAIVLGLTGCTSPVGDSQPEGRLVVDSYGRELVLPENPKRIGAFYPMAGHGASLLDRNIDIVAVSNGLKRDILLEKINPSLKDAVVAGSGREVNIETLINQQPDLLIITGNMAEEAGQLKKLDNLGIPYIIVEYSNMEEQQEAIRIMGQALGQEEKAKKYTDYYSSVVELMEDRLADLAEDEKYRVFHSISEAARTESKNSLCGDWLETAGLINVVESDEDLTLFENTKYFASLEQIYVWNPDLYLVQDNDVYDYLMSNEQWSGLDAIVNENVYVLPHGISRWGHVSSLEIPLVLLWSGKTFYGDRFEDIDLNHEIKYYYKEFYDYELSDQDVDNILKNQGMRLD